MAVEDRYGGGGADASDGAPEPDSRVGADWARDDWTAPGDDDLDRAFGPDTASVRTRPLGQRIRTWLLVGGGVVLVTAVALGALWFVVNGVQNGIGGVFPNPSSALSRFEARAAGIDGVTATADIEQKRTTFASYDVAARVTVDPSVDADAQVRLLDELSDAADAASGNGIHVYAIAELGDLRIGVSPDARLTESRLELARKLDAIGGVRAVRCDWSGDGEGGAIRDEPAGQRVVVATPAKEPVLAALTAAVQQTAAAAFPDAQVRIDPMAAG